MRAWHSFVGRVLTLALGRLASSRSSNLEKGPRLTVGMSTETLTVVKTTFTPYFFDCVALFHSGEAFDHLPAGLTVETQTLFGLTRT